MTQIQLRCCLLNTLCSVSCYLPQYNGKTVKDSLRRTMCFSADKGRSRLDNNSFFVVVVAERSLKTSSHHPLTARTTTVSLDSLQVRQTRVRLLVTGSILVKYKVTTLKKMVFLIILPYTNLQPKNSLRQEGSRSDI